MGSILDHIVQEPGEHRGLVLFKVCKNLGNFVGVLGIGHATFTVLSVMGIGNKGYSSLQDPFVQLGILLEEDINDVLLVGCQVESFH